MAMPQYRLIELTEHPGLLAHVWDWQKRSPAYNAEEAPTLEDVSGLQWAHFCLLEHGEPKVVLSFEEKRENGYEVHVNTAQGTRPDLVRWFIECVVTAILSKPESRLVCWIAVGHRAAQRLARRYMTEETRSADGAFVRFGVSGAEWGKQWARAAKAAA